MTPELDYDLRACLEYNPQGTFAEADIAEVLAVYEGENDERDWRWVLRLHDGRFVFLQGGCDYTGWDCQSSADHRFAESAEAAAYCALNDPADYHSEVPAVYASLIEQLSNGKAETWRERTDRDMGVQS